MNRDNMHIDEDEIDIKEIFRTIYRYRYMILLLVVVFGFVSSYYAYFKPNVYQASATVEVGLDQRGYGSQDMLAMAMDSGTMNADTEMEIIKSRFLTEKALDEVDFSHHYYTTRRFKEVELYKASPFQVGMLEGYDISFDLYPVDENSYRLVVEEAEDSEGNIWSYDAVHSYDKEIVTAYFHLNVTKTNEPDDEKYRFVVFDPKDIASYVQGGVSVSQKSKYSAILEISYSDNVALRAQEFTNALARAYIEQNIEKKTQEATRKLTFIDNQLKLITENLKGSAIKLEEFKKTSNTVSLSAKAENIIRQMSESETKLTEISIELEMLGTLYEQVKSGKNLESITIAGLDKEASSLSSMIKELQDAIMKKRILREEYTEMFSEVRKLTKTIEQLKKLIISTIKSLNKSIKERKELIGKSILEQQKLLNTLPADERMFGQLQRKFVVNEKIYSYLLEKRSETAIIKESTVSKNRIIDEALYPGFPIKPKRKLIVLVGLILGLILGIAVAFLREFLDDRIKAEEDVTKVIDVPILGLIPHMKEVNDKGQVFSSPKSALAESFRNIRTNLQFMARDKHAHVIAITSTVGGEGKTTTSINLGGIMSMADKKTVILNLDMRKPTLHQKFGLINSKGMSTLLSGHTALGEVIQNTEFDNLDIITSGPVPPNPSELIQSPLMENVLEKLREEYDVIILDTPPIGLVTDARTLMHFADTSIYLLRADYSKKGFLRSIDKLSKEEIRGLGILLNDVKMDRSGYGYGYGYGYYEEDKK
ncbi:tyrosine-protein kinase family protein [Sulfurovum sp. AR]|uniref:GumC family protein n=1 Tax=Sulfurovum sp. AR TaxID=1165841 RepID=UPI00025C4FA4|nr:tyrosine-protein kinase family protein [Sulfurovum sp. AR]EIF51211.1 capsular polysaccharide biosynthesis protein [Sulfurovum sp. AR]